jgi:hypothetical protein
LNVRPAVKQGKFESVFDCIHLRHVAPDTLEDGVRFVVGWLVGSVRHARSFTFCLRG